MEENLSEQVKQELTDLLRKLEARTELEACAVVSKEGMRIACAVSAELDADVYSAASAALVNLGETTLRQLRHGNLVEIIVRGDDGYTILTGAGSKHMMIGSCKNITRMGYYLALLHRFSTKVASILGTEIEAPTAAPRPAPVITAAGPTAASLLEPGAAAMQAKAMQARTPPMQVRTLPKEPTPTPKPVPFQPQKFSQVKPEPVDNKISEALEYLTPVEEPEPIQKIEEPEPISVDEPEPLAIAEEPEPIPIDETAPVRHMVAPKTATSDVDKGALFEALHALGTDKAAPAPPQPSSKVDTKALMDALKPQPTVTRPTPAQPTTKAIPFSAQPPPAKPVSKPAGKPSAVPFAATAPPAGAAKEADDDLFKISDKEAVLEALKVLGWEEPEDKKEAR
jgi:predicted regulator of Ras-like GTPase activity (Roadblock/LC7/MglB family)